MADRDTSITFPTGRGDEFAHKPDLLDRPKPVVIPRDMFVPDLHIDMLKVKAGTLTEMLKPGVLEAAPTPLKPL